MRTFFISLFTVFALIAQPAFADDVGTAIYNLRGADAGSSKVSADDKQYDKPGGMAIFTIATCGFMNEAKLGGEKFKTEPLSGGFFCGAIPPSSDSDQSSTTEKWIST